MDIVVRTPHGEADVSIGGHEETTLGDVLGAITGQAAPRLALVDGRAVDGSCPLDEAGLLTGSVVTTEPSLPVPAAPTAVDVLQIAGHGAGRVVRLGPGQYRMGPGRRVTAEELDLAPVDEPTIDLVVESTATTTEVTVVPLVPDVELDGEPVTTATTWQDETLTVGARAFRLATSDAPPEVDPGRPDPSLRHDADAGTITFSRPPRRRDPPRRYPVVDALRDAQHTAPWLWERRPQHADALSLTFGLVPGEGSDEANTNAEVDLASETGVAIVGSEEFRTSLARTLVVEAATVRGPADVDLVVFTSPERLGDWDWAKWLPHARIGGPPAIAASDHEIERWVQELDAAAPHVTIAILDEPGLWRRTESPLQPMLGGPPAGVKVIALCDDPSRAPAICSAMITETPAGRARFHSFTGDADVDDLRPSLTEIGVAVRIARALAPLVDVELPPTPIEAPVDAVRLGDLLGTWSADDVLARWAATPRPTVAVGRRDRAPVEIDATDGVTIVIGTSMHDAFAVAAPFLLQQCLEWPPDALWVLPLIVTDQRRSDLLWELPHATERHDAATPIEPDRLLARIRAVLADEHGPSRILMIVEDSRLSPASPDDDLLAALVRAGRTTDGLGVLVLTDRGARPVPGVPESADDTVIRIERPHGTAGGRRATISAGDGRPGEPFTPPEPNDATARGLEIVPLVVGRPLSPLERWVEQEQARAGGPPDPALRNAVDSLRRAARSSPPPAGGPERVLVPPALPEHVGLDELFRSSPGDGVPLGLGDDPATGRLQPRWWQPGQGSMLAFGSRRSGIEQVPTVIVLGLLDRFAAEDVRLVVVEPSASRRRALDAIDGAPVARAADRSDDVVRTLDEIEGELGRVATSASHDDRPRLVVVAADLALLRRQFGDGALVARIDEVLERAARAGSGVDVIAYAGDLEGAGPFGEAASLRVVGASSDHTDLARLGVQDPSDLEGVAGRCRWFPDGDLVQLALPADDLETMLARRSTDDAT